MNKENICHRNLKLSNILISYSNLTDLEVKLCDYSLSQFSSAENAFKSTHSSFNSSFFDLSNKTIDQNKERQRSSFYCMAPETLKNNSFTLKSDIWSLGIIIYYMFHKEYPFNGRNQIQYFMNINENKNTKLKSTGNEILDDLIEKMLAFEEEKRINWTQYFEHEFFKTDFSSSQFNLNCYNHPNSDCKYYCTNCRRNICPNCKKKCENSDHRVIEMYKIGFNENEEKEMDTLITDINNNIEELEQLKNNISTYFKKMLSVKTSITIDDSDPNDFYKTLLMNDLKEIKKIQSLKG
jgi:serine/threonine protein kinase